VDVDPHITSVRMTLYPKYEDIVVFRKDMDAPNDEKLNFKVED